MNEAKHIVIDEDILGYRLPTTIKGYTNFGIFAAKSHRYMGNPFPGPDSAADDRIRPATADDFKNFRVKIPPDFVAPLI